MHGFEYNIALIAPFLLFAVGLWLRDTWKASRSSPTPPSGASAAEAPQVSDVEPLTVEDTQVEEEKPRARPDVSPTGVRGAWIRVQPRGTDAP